MEDMFSQWMHLTRNTESPEVFHMWSLVTTIAAATHGRIWLQDGWARIFPQHFVVIVAGSAVARKGVPLDFVQRLYDTAFVADDRDAQLLTGEMTYERLCERLANDMGDSRPSFLISPELGRFMSKMAQQRGIAYLLIDLYDKLKNVTYSTKTQGESVILNPYFSILGATTPAWLTLNVSQDTFQEGLIGRIIFVYAEGPKRRIPRPIWSKDDEALFRRFATTLYGISTLQGPMHFTPEAGKVYDDWYVKLPVESDQRGKKINMVSGFDGRVGTHVKKLSMVLTLASGEGMSIGPDKVEAAIAMLAEIRSMLPAIFAYVEAENEPAKQQVAVLEFIYKHQPCTRRQIQAAVWKRGIGAVPLEEALITLLDAGQIKEERGPIKQTTLYRTTRKADEIL